MMADGPPALSIPQRAGSGTRVSDDSGPGLASDDPNGAKCHTAKRIGLSFALSAGLAAAVHAESHCDLARLPVKDMTTVPVAQYVAASAVAARGGAPIEIALAVAGGFEGVIQHVIQRNSSSEAPAASGVAILRDGLLDDAIRGERWEIALERTSTGMWRIKEVKRAWRCRRGADPDRFTATRCP